MRVPGDVGLVADDRLDAPLLALVVELDRAVEIAVIGDRAGIHAELLGLLDQRGNAIDAVEEAVVRVKVKVTELALGHRGPRRRGETYRGGYAPAW